MQFSCLHNKEPHLLFSRCCKGNTMSFLHHMLPPECFGTHLIELMPLCANDNMYGEKWAYSMIKACAACLGFDQTVCQHLQSPSIHFLPLNPLVGSRGGWSLSQQSSGERRGTPWTDRQSITGPHRDKRDKRDKQPCTLTPKDNFRVTN